jgi:hypothetical protein
MYLRRAELKWDFIIKYYWREGMKIKQAFADVKLKCGERELLSLGVLWILVLIGSDFKESCRLS